MDNPYQTSQHASTGLSGGSNQQVTASQNALQLLYAAKGWMRFMSVLFWLGFAFYCFAFFSSLSRNGGMGILLNLFVCLVFFFLALYLTKSANAIGRLQQTNSPLDLERALVNQGKYWLWAGIFSLVMLIVIGFVFLAGLLSTV